MAKTELYRLAGGEVRPVRYRVIKNSEVIKVGDFITDEAVGVANVDAVTESIMGFCVDIVTAKKISLQATAVPAGDYDGTWDAATLQYTAASDNQTDKKVLCAYIPARE